MKKYILIALLLFTACSTKTIYNINIDLLSFFNANKLEQSIVFPVSLDFNIYLFPGVELDLSNTGPGPDAQQGIILNFPIQEINELNEFSAKLEIATKITNKSLTEQITGDRISLYFAPLDANNIYTEGIRFDLINVGIIMPLETAVLVQDFYFEEYGPLLEILRTGTLRFGMGIYLTASSEFIPADYLLDKISLSTSFTPIDILLLNDL